MIKDLLKFKDGSSLDLAYDDQWLRDSLNKVIMNSTYGRCSGKFAPINVDFIKPKPKKLKNDSLFLKIIKKVK